MKPIRTIEHRRKGHVVSRFSIGPPQLGRRNKGRYVSCHRQLCSIASFPRLEGNMGNYFGSFNGRPWCLYNAIFVIAVFILGANNSCAQSSQQCVQWLAVQEVYPCINPSTLIFERLQILSQNLCLHHSHMSNRSPVSTVNQRLLHGLNGARRMFKEPPIPVAPLQSVFNSVTPQSRIHSQT